MNENDRSDQATETLPEPHADFFPEEVSDKQKDFTHIPEDRIKIYARDIDAWFGEKQVLKKIYMPIEKERVTAIIGPSGCGKSTFIRTLNRIHELIPGSRFSGKVILEDQDIYEPRVNPVMVRRRIGMVFQKPNPFPMMSIKENILSGLMLQGKKVKNPGEIVEKALRQAALWDEVKDELNKPGSRLSGGQQQRLCIARTLATEPDVILMDEPCSALDPIATTRIEDLIHSLRENYTIVIVTHNMQQAMRVSDYTAFFYMGEMIEYSDTKTMFTTPHRKHTDDYITGRFG